MTGLRRPRFEDLTESAGVPISPEGAAMMYTRYRVASRLAEGKRVLEVGCGSGPGLGIVGASAERVMGADYSLTLLRNARLHYGARFPFVRLSADGLPFADERFDLVLCLEATYYVPDMAAAFREMVRVLRPAGMVLLVNANPERPDFIRSPHSTHYHTADEFRTALSGLGLEVQVEGAFPVEPSAVGASLSLARRVLERLHLVPRTLRGRARLKRLIYGPLRSVPPELEDGFAEEGARVPVPPGPVRGFKVLYIIGRRPRLRRGADARIPSGP